MAVPKQKQLDVVLSESIYEVLQVSKVNRGDLLRSLVLLYRLGQLVNFGFLGIVLLFEHFLEQSQRHLYLEGVIAFLICCVKPPLGFLLVRIGVVRLADVRVVEQIEHVFNLGLLITFLPVDEVFVNFFHEILVFNINQFAVGVVLLELTSFLLLLP